MSSIKENAHHSIMLITGARTRLCCPHCDSSNFYVQKTYDQIDVHYSDGHIDEGYMDYCCSDYRCDDCGHMDAL